MAMLTKEDSDSSETLPTESMEFSSEDEGELGQESEKVEATPFVDVVLTRLLNHLRSMEEALDETKKDNMDAEGTMIVDMMDDGIAATAEMEEGKHLKSNL